MTVPQSRKFKKGRDYELDMKTPDEDEVKTRRKYLQQTNHYTQVVKQVIDGILHYLLYKSEKPTRLRFYPLPIGRMQI